MEKTTINTFLYAGNSKESLSKLVDITSYPDVMSAPEKVDVSDLSSKQKKYTDGMIDLPDYEFGANYTASSYAKLNGMKDTKQFFELRFGKDGEYGKFSWQGTLFPIVSGGDVGGKREMKITCYPATEVEFEYTSSMIE